MARAHRRRGRAGERQGLERLPGLPRGPFDVHVNVRACLRDSARAHRCAHGCRAERAGVLRWLADRSRLRAALPLASRTAARGSSRAPPHGMTAPASPFPPAPRRALPTWTRGARRAARRTREVCSRARYRARSGRSRGSRSCACRARAARACAARKRRTSRLRCLAADSGASLLPARRKLIQHGLTGGIPTIIGLLTRLVTLYERRRPSAEHPARRCGHVTCPPLRPPGHPIRAGTSSPMERPIMVPDWRARSPPSWAS